MRAEIARQEKILDSGGVVQQMTMLWDEASGTTQPMRSKEQAHDYRYFPEPDLVPLDINDEWLERVREAMPELPRARRQRFQESLGLSPYDAEVLTTTREIADYFESAIDGYDKPKAIANWLANELLGRLNAQSKTISQSPVAPNQLRDLLKLIDSGAISGKQAKEVFDEMVASGAGRRCDCQSQRHRANQRHQRTRSHLPPRFGKQPASRARLFRRQRKIVRLPCRRRDERKQRQSESGFGEYTFARNFAEHEIAISR